MLRNPHDEQHCLEAILEEDARLTQLMIEQNELLTRIAEALEVQASRPIRDPRLNRIG